jgi:hypothetical protein
VPRVVAGIVFDEHGKPLGDGRVNAYVGDDWLTGVETDVHGRFRIVLRQEGHRASYDKVVVPGETVHLRVTRRGWAFRTAYNVRVGRDDVVLRFREGRSIAGTVVLPADAARPERIFVHTRGEDSEGYAEVAPDGTFLVRGLDDETYDVSASAAGLLKGDPVALPAGTTGARLDLRAPISPR